MAVRKSTSKGRSGRNRAAIHRGTCPSELPRSARAETLEGAIERERARLMRADSVLGCASLALEYGDNADPRRPYYSDVVDLARELVSESALRLDSVNLRPLMHRRQKLRARRR